MWAVKKGKLLDVEAEDGRALHVSFLSAASKLISAALPKAPSLHLHPSLSLSEAFQLAYLPFLSRNISSNGRGGALALIITHVKLPKYDQIKSTVSYLRLREPVSHWIFLIAPVSSRKGKVLSSPISKRSWPCSPASRRQVHTHSEVLQRNRNPFLRRGNRVSSSSRTEGLPVWEPAALLQVGDVRLWEAVQPLQPPCLNC